MISVLPLAITGPDGRSWSLLLLDDVSETLNTAMTTGLLVLVGVPFVFGMALSLFHHEHGRFSFVGLANFVVPDAKLLEEAVTLAKRIASKPQQATEETKRAVNLHMHQALLRVGPFASMAEQESFGTKDVLAAVERFTKR